MQFDYKYGIYGYVDVTNYIAFIVISYLLSKIEKNLSYFILFLLEKKVILIKGAYQ